MQPNRIRVRARLASDIVEFDMPAPTGPPQPPANPPAEPVPAAAGGAAPGMSHSTDFAGVLWGTERFAFGPKQRAVVAALWQAMVEGYEFVGQETLLDLAESDGSRLRDVFRGHPAWGTMIQSAVMVGGPVSSFRLARPE